MLVAVVAVVGVRVGSIGTELAPVVSHDRPAANMTPVLSKTDHSEKLLRDYSTFKPEHIE